MALNFRQKVLSTPLLAKWAFNLWPPFWGTGFWLTKIHSDYQEIQIKLNLRFYNRNYIGIHFGGSLFSMTDPFYTLMLFKNLGKNYFVCDKAAKIEYLKPGKNHVMATFKIDDNLIDTIKEKTKQGDAFIAPLSVEIKDLNSQEVIAKVHRELFIQHKAKKIPL